MWLEIIPTSQVFQLMCSQTLVSRPVAVSGDFATIVRHLDQKKKLIVDKKLQKTLK